jgi:hypothetical protein
MASGLRHGSTAQTPWGLAGGQSVPAVAAEAPRMGGEHARHGEVERGSPEWRGGMRRRVSSTVARPGRRWLPVGQWRRR